MYNKIKIVAGIIVLTVIASCSQSGGNFAGYEYAPDMYYAKGPEAYRMLESDTAKSFMHMWTPVANTIARGKLDYFFPYNDDTTGYRMATKEVTCP